MKKDQKSVSPNTLLAQAGHYVDSQSGAVVPPIHTATTYARDETYTPLGGRTYARDENPTFEQVEALLAQLDGGTDAKLFASGLAAAAAVFETVPLGKHIVAPQVMYHGAQSWLKRLADKRGLKLTLFDATEPGALQAALRPGETDLVWIEPLANPTWDVTDVAAAAEAAHNAGAALAVDATVTPPVTLKALNLGADIVFHSATKYLNGHSDVLAGVLITGNQDARWDEIISIRILAGAVPGPMEAWLLLRGLRTLGLRFDRASANAARIAAHFDGHPKLERVLYPGLESHPGHAVAQRQLTGGLGGMLSILVTGGADAAIRVATSTKLFIPATSLGGVESLIEHRASVEPADSPVPGNLLRLSVGIEDADDLIADLEQALERA